MKAIRALKIVLKDTVMSRERAYLKECIEELEALNNRSCENCVYYLSDNGNYPLEPCGECSRWYSDRWESK